MFTRDERRALLFLAAVAAAGGAMRVVRAPGTAPGSPVVAPDLPAGDVARQARLSRQALELARPLQPGEHVDVDRAGALELERLPRVGPALARRIIDEREANGPFGSLEGLGRVPGIGSAMLKGFERTATFSGTPRTDRLTARPPDRLTARTPDRLTARPPDRLSLNTATAAELDGLPGVGPSLAAQIVTWRAVHGGFREVQELEQVPGIGRTRATRLASLVRVP